MADKPTKKPTPKPTSMLPHRKALAMGLQPNTGGSYAKGPTTRP